MADKLHLLRLQALTGGEVSFCPDSLGLWHRYRNSLPCLHAAFCRAVGTSSPNYLSGRLCIQNRDVVNCWVLPGKKRKPCIWGSARKTSEHMVNEGWVPMSRHRTLEGQRSCVLDRDVLLVPALASLVQLRKWRMLFLENIYRCSSLRTDVLL